MLVGLSACVSDEQAATDEAPPTPMVIESSATVQPEAEESEPEVTEEPAEEGGEEAVLPEEFDELGTRTPMPTATPGVLAEEISRITEELGVEEQTVLGLGIDDWLILIIALLLTFGVYVFATWLERRFLPRLARRTETELDDRLLQVAGREIRWLLIILTFQIVTVRLVFLSAGIKTLLIDLYFLVAMGLSIRIVMQSVDLAAEEVQARMEAGEREQELAPLMKLAVLITRFLVIVIFISIVLSHFGVNVTVIAAVMGLGGLAISLAARDTIADVIAGFIILIDRPFRIGDRIEIKGLDAWGDVTDIGLRTTSIRTRDNRMVIVPNSNIGNNEIVNYSYPDPEYRIQTHIAIAYGTPIKDIQKVVYETVRGVDGVLENRPVDVLYHEMGDSAMVFRVRWWIGTYADNRRVLDRVHIALQEAIDEAGFESPFPTQTIHLETGSSGENVEDSSGSESD